MHQEEKNAAIELLIGIRGENLDLTRSKNSEVFDVSIDVQLYLQSDDTTEKFSENVPSWNISPVYIQTRTMFQANGLQALVK